MPVCRSLMYIGMLSVKYNKVYDIGVTLETESGNYIGDTPFSKDLMWTIKESEASFLRAVLLC